MTPQELLALAGVQPRHSPERALYLAAAIEQFLGTRFVVVGGAAANRFTGEYRPTDLDLVGPMDANARARLTALGFVDRGVGHRHLEYAFADDDHVLVEFPDTQVDGVHPPEIVEVAPGAFAHVIQVEDLMLDRLRQATTREAITHDAALVLLVAVWDRLDHAALEARIAQEARDLLTLTETWASLRAEVLRGPPGNRTPP